MNGELWHLVRAKMAEVEEDLRTQGYEVRREVDGFDMVATKPGSRIVYEFVAHGELGTEKEMVLEKRARARAAGCDDFRLVVVRHPHRVDVDVEGLGASLCDYLAANVPPELEDMSGNLSIESVDDIEYDVVYVSADGIRLRGTGVVEVLLGHAEGRWKDLQGKRVACPLRFDVRVQQDLQVAEPSSVEVDADACF